MEKDSILIITNKGDASVEPVIVLLEKMRENFYRFNTETFPSETKGAFSLDKNGFSGFIGKENNIINIKNIKSVWYRRPALSFVKQGTPSGFAKFIRDEASASLWSFYTILEDIFWMNHPLMASRLLEHNKLYQLKIASLIGLNVPDTIITNKPAELLSFCDKHGGIVAIKLIKGNSFVREGDIAPLFIFTQKILIEDIKKHIEDIEMAPVMAEEYVEKHIELRVTVVKDRIFSCAIHSQDSEKTKIDWRYYDFDNVKHEPHQLPKEIEIKLIQLLKKWNLSFGAIDMVLTPDGKYVFLEINPNGQWFWIEQITGMPISETIAKTLANP